MRIGIDARELSGTPTGVGRYVAELLAAWSESPRAAAHEFLLFAPEPVAATEFPLRTTVHLASGRGTRWGQLTLPALLREHRPDVLFAPAYEAPLLARVPTVLAVHDVSFMAHPEWFSRREGLRRRVLTTWSARRAARILTFSQFSRDEIVRYLRVPADRIDVIYHGATPLVSRAVQSDAVTPGTAHGDPLVLYVGSIFNRRHVPELIAGFSRLAARYPAARLALIGENRTSPRLDVGAMIAADGMRDRITAHDYVADETLASFYRRAAAFVFLSDYEGFGMTPLEALAAGAPIVVLDTPVSREIYGAAALYVARPDPALIEAALEDLLGNPAVRARLLDAAGPVLARYSWPACAARTLDVLIATAT